MDFEQYSERVMKFLVNDNREINYQNRVLIPLLEELLSESDIVDTSTLYKNWAKRGVDRDAFAGIHTPDILVAQNWNLLNSSRVEYSMLIEAKTPTASERKWAISEVKEYLKKVPFVMLTDCITFEFFYKENGAKYTEIHTLEVGNENEKTKVCERKTEKNLIALCDEEWEEIKKIIKDRKIRTEANNQINL